MCQRLLVDKLRVVRRRKGITQAELAAVSGYERTVVSRMENGHVATSLQTIIDLANALECDVRIIERKRPWQ